MKLLRPRRLRPGDRIAVVSLSWGGPAAHPGIFELGLRNLRDRFGLEVVEFPTARMKDDELYRNPRLRADDFNAALRDSSVAGIISSVGGYDSVRILPFVDADAIRRNPKVIMGYSDTTTVLTYANLLGLVTFYGPSIMGGIAQTGSFPQAFQDHLHALLFAESRGYRYHPYEVWSDWYPDWNERSPEGKISNRQPNQAGWQWLQGAGQVQGRLWGGCLEVLEFLKGTPYWPEPAFWKGRALFFETSEEHPTVRQVVYILRNYGVAGAFDSISALLVGRPKGYSDAEKVELYAALRRVVGEEFGRPELPIVANLDFGHTDPKLVLPLGALVTIDCGKREIEIAESCTNPA